MPDYVRIVCMHMSDTISFPVFTYSAARVRIRRTEESEWDTCPARGLTVEDEDEDEDEDSSEECGGFSSF